MTVNQKWDEVKLSVWFDQQITKDIFATHIPEIEEPDEITWLHTKNGQYEVKSGY